MPKKLTTNDFIQAAENVHGSLYNYDAVNYINTYTPIRVGCSVHGEFTPTPKHHLRGLGCPSCAPNNKLTTESFIIQANRVHDNKYLYAHTEYVRSHDKIIITCKKHGEFAQRPNDHLSGNGCMKCARDTAKGNYNFGYFSRNPSMKKQKGLFYIIKIVVDDTVYLKIGITKNSLKERYKNYKGLKMDTIASYQTTLYDAYRIEQDIKLMFTDYQSSPHNFNGRTECFSIVAEKEMLNYFNNM